MYKVIYPSANKQAFLALIVKCTFKIMIHCRDVSLSVAKALIFCYMYTSATAFIGMLGVVNLGRWRRCDILLK